MKVYIYLVALFGLSQCTVVEWTPQEYPNPQTQPADCGRTPDQPSYVCDPNGIISTSAADTLDYILLNLQNDTACPCSALNCEQRTQNSGYIIAIALVRKLKRDDTIPDTVEGKKGLAREFVFNLLRKKWKSWGVCDEVTIILFSKEDGILMTLSGTTPRRKLSDEVALAIQTELAKFFRSDGNVGQGLHYLTLNYRRVLDGHNYYPVMYADATIANAANMLKVSIVTSLLTTLLWQIFC